jgi:putative flippase GtrA
MTIREGSTTLIGSLPARRSALTEFLRYLVVGGLAFLLDFSSLFCLKTYVKLNYLVAAAIAFMIGMAVNYLLSISWVFSKRRLGVPALEFLVFAVIGVIGLGLNELGMYVFVHVAGLHYLLAKILTAAGVLVWNFAARKASLFR